MRHLAIFAILVLSSIGPAQAFDENHLAKAKSGQGCDRCDLTRASLSGADLKGGNFEWSDFSKSNMSGADLSGPNLSEAVLTGALLCGANLTDARVDQGQIGAANGDDATKLRAGLTKPAQWKGC
jgi:uncharacterized protein YjbI with pentapeptide repeats